MIPHTFNTLVGGDADHLYLVVFDHGPKTSSRIGFITGMAFLHGITLFATMTTLVSVLPGLDSPMLRKSTDWMASATGYRRVCRYVRDWKMSGYLSTTCVTTISIVLSLTLA